MSRSPPDSEDLREPDILDVGRETGTTHPRTSNTGAASVVPGGARSWRPSALVGASMALHGVALAAAVLRRDRGRGLWPWLLADHAVLTLAGALPRSDLLGRCLVRVPEEDLGKPNRVMLTFDDGPDPEVTQRLGELLAHRGARATFFCIGRRGERYPELVLELVRQGHRIENHTYHHRHDFAFHLYPALLREIRLAQEVIAGVTGRVPVYFRAPAGMRNPFLDPVLARLGLHLVAWTRRGWDTVDGRPARLVARLVRRLAPGDVLLLHDGNGARTADGSPAVLETTERLLDCFERRGLEAVALPSPGSRRETHPSDTGADAGAAETR